MNATVTSLEQANENTADIVEKTEILLKLCNEYGQLNHRQMLEYAKEAEHYARKTRRRNLIAAALRERGRALHFVGDYQNAVPVLQASLDMYTTIGDKSKMTDLLCDLSMAHIFNGLPDKARESLLEAEEKCLPNINTKALVRLYHSWNSLYRTLSDPEKMLYYAGKILTVSEESGYSLGIILACRDLGFLAMCYGDFDRARQHYNRALELSCSTGVTSQELQILHDVAYLCLKMANLDEALAIARRYESVASEIGADIAIVQSQIALCEVLLARNEFKQALTQAKKLTRAARHYNLQAVMVAAYLTRANVHKACAQFDEALTWYERTKEYCQQAESVGSLMLIEEALAQIYEQRGDLQQAYIQYRNYMQKHEQLLGFMKQKAIASASVAIQVEQIERDKHRLEKKMQSLEIDIEQKQQELTSSALLVAEKDEVLAELRTELREILAMPQEQSKQALTSLIARLGRSFDPPQAWEEFNRQFQVADPRFIRTLTMQYGKLTPTELKICSLLRVNLSTKDIASLLSIQPSSVDIYRSTIRKKLQLPRGKNLTVFLSRM